MNTLILAATVLGCCTAFPQNLGRAQVQDQSSRFSYDGQDQYNQQVRHDATRSNVQHQVLGTPVQPIVEHVPIHSQTGLHGNVQVPHSQVQQAAYQQPKSLRPEASPLHRVAILTMNQEATYDGNFNYE